ncbi:hypothetical protein Taro_007456 [Colocasia esculenta]|uniref:Ubiquitin-like protease family profile domain-containing protein n=1 Tax=Colocasia esculenta TaxID=4460 RepID=A0A843TZQ4_COLES|nr:hypothetical protein [Colocasia esculenta]
MDGAVFNSFIGDDCTSSSIVSLETESIENDVENKILGSDDVDINNLDDIHVTWEMILQIKRHPSIIIDRISNNKRNCSYLWSILSAEHLQNCDCWDCLWFPYYKSNASQRKKMLTRVKDKEVFLKKYSFVPICMGHWSLVILCHKEEDDLPFIMLYDSLHSIDPTKLVRLIKRFHNKPMALSVDFLYYTTSTISYRMIHPHFPWMITHLLRVMLLSQITCLDF